MSILIALWVGARAQAEPERPPIVVKADFFHRISRGYRDPERAAVDRPTDPTRTVSLRPARRYSLVAPGGYEQELAPINTLPGPLTSPRIDLLLPGATPGHDVRAGGGTLQVRVDGLMLSEP